MVSLEDYREAVQSFMKLCTEVGEEWEALFEDDPDEARLMIVKKQTVNKEVEPLRSQDDADPTNEKNKNLPLSFEYHVIYNQPFSVPQLLFSATRPDGSLVPLSSLHEWIPQSLISREAGERGKEYLWETLTQIEHPVLHRPIYALHPCQTSSFITQIRQFSKNWFLSWLSSIGPAVGLVIPLSLAKAQYNLGLTPVLQ